MAKNFQGYLQLVMKGYICFEEEARQLAKSHYQQAEVDAALKIGAAILYHDYLSCIREGQTEEYTKVALRHARRFGFEIGPLEEAVLAGEVVRSRRVTIKPEGD